MTEQEMQEARTNPEFLKYLQQKEDEAINTKDLASLYEVLDNLLILDLDEQRVQKVYETILDTAFTKIEQRLLDDSKLKLNNNDIYFIRAFYEHAVEKYSYKDFEGAMKLFFILSELVEDEKLAKSMAIHLIACDNKTDMDKFYTTMVSSNQMDQDEQYGYFIVNYNFDIDNYLDQNKKQLQKLANQLGDLIK
jgi:hypothetical protein